MEKIAVFSDHQARWDDKITEISVRKWLRDFKPDIIAVNGDVFDFEALSSFRKSLKAQMSVKADIEAGRNIVRHYREDAPNAQIIFNEGNHEDRWNRYILDRAPEMEETFGSLWDTIRLDEFGVQYGGKWGEGFHWGDIFIYHGSKVNSQSAYTARAELAMEGGSGVSGHTHRLGSFFITARDGTHQWLENGTLCNIKGPDMPPHARGPHVLNWQQGFSWGYKDDANDIWNMYQTAIIDHKFIHDGFVYKP